MNSGTPRFFNLFGIISTLSVAAILIYVLPGALKGDFSAVTDFLAAYPGIEPFLVFFLPVVVISCAAWLWKLYSGRGLPD